MKQLIIYANLTTGLSTNWEVCISKIGQYEKSLNIKVKYKKN